MKLKHLLSGVLALGTMALQAQLTNAILPTVGQTITYTAASSQTPYNPGAAGSGITWDFSNLAGSGNYSATFYGPNQNPTGLTCNGTTITEADQQNGVTAISINYQATSSTYQNTCSNVPSQQLSYTYTDYFKVLDFPCAYNDTVYDVFSGTGDYGGTPLVTNGWAGYKVDGVGTLILPNGTFNNVIRIHRRTKQYVMIDPYFSEDTLNITTGSIYEFYRQGSTLTLLTIKSETQDIPLTGQSVSNNSFVIQGNLNSIGENLISSPVELYPNPASGNATLAVNLKQQANVSYSVYDATGREIRAFNQDNTMPGSQTFNIDLNGLSSGIYVVRYGVNGQYQSSRLFVK